MSHFSGGGLSEEAVVYIVHHVILPPKLPQHNDTNPKHESILLQITIEALEEFQTHFTKTDEIQQVQAVADALSNLLQSRDSKGVIRDAQLSSLLKGIHTGETRGAIPLEVKAQNAGLVISRQGQSVIFESFELSPSNHAVFATKGRLVRSFPASASMVSLDQFQEDGLQGTLARTIATMDFQPALGFQPQVRKSGRDQGEWRDTTNPGMVTDYLMTFIAALGKHISTPGISKNTREEVLWSDAKEPWHRSPLWLMIRVTMQLQFSRAAETSRSSENLFKPFMVFLLSKVLTLVSVHHATFEPEVIHNISAKLSRRIKKIKHLLRPTWMKSVWETMISSHDLIEKNWNSVISGPSPHVDGNWMRNLRPEEDLDLDLPQLTHHINDIARRTKNCAKSDFQPTTVYPEFPAHEVPSTLGTSGEQIHSNLIAIETWVQRHLQTWLNHRIAEAESCGKLRSLVQSYHAIAVSAYADLPISKSIMYLTILELWVACDKSACQVHKLLREYDPQVSEELLQSLLLPLKDQMRRLSDVERYIKSRKRSARTDAPSPFRKYGHPLSFAVRFFDQSPPHQALKSQIEQDATTKQGDKRQELATKKQEHRKYMDLYEQNTCDEIIIKHAYYDYEETKHDPQCERCRWRTIAQQINIQVYEWPLSTDPSVAKATVFELQAPEAFTHWRDVTLFLVADVLESDSQKQDGARATFTLDKDQGLQSFLSHTGYVTQRIVPLSQIKSNTVCHRGKKDHNVIPNLDVEDVCVENALRYLYYDQKKEIFISDWSPNERVCQNCTYQLPSRSSDLQKYLHRPPLQPGGVTPNEVIASQSSCPVHMSLEEYNAFGTLPFGNRIQYSNILVQLSMPALVFGKVETQCLLFQIIHQAGPSSDQNDVERVNHEILADEDFGRIMISQLKVALQRVTENWESWRALACFVKLATRILTLSTSSTIQEQSLSYLKQARDISIRWLDILKERIQTSTDDGQRSELLSRAVEVALVCISTFDTDQDHAVALLKVRSEASIFLQCSMTIQENKESVISEHKSLYLSMLQSWHRLVFRVVPALQNEITVCGNKGLDDAVTVSWSAFRQTNSWKSLGGSKQYWLTTSVSPDEDGVALQAEIHFNLLTAELLVNGLPLARLPQVYMRHSMYSALFCKSALEVVPTAVPGFKFSAKHRYKGYELRFGMQGLDMLVQAVQGEKHFDLLPSGLFVGKVPTSFVESFIHWYDHENEEVQFRPCNDPWSFSKKGSDVWRLQKFGRFWRLTKPGFIMVKIGSDSAKALSRIFEPLEDHMCIHTLFNESSKSVDIEIPRLQLGFYLEYQGCYLHSHQYRGMIVDQSQETGTLIGLSSKLVLKDKHRDRDRLLLVPEGPVTYSKNHSHVSVRVDKEAAAKIHSYLLNTTLGQVVVNGNLQSKLYLCYLHALTSHCLPDPLTGFTGTESAMAILRSAAVRSFDILTKDNVTTLELIAKLAPARRYYPENEKEMQEIGWNSKLPTLSQDSDLYTLVGDIFAEAQKVKFFYSADVYVEPPVLDFIDPDLLQRDMIRSSTFRVCDFGAEHYSSQFDVAYKSRDQDQSSERARRSFVAATLIIRPQEALQTAPRLLTDLRNMYFSDLTKGPCKVSLNLGYDTKWLGGPKSYVPDVWCDIHANLARSYAHNKFDIMIWLSNSAYAELADMNIIDTFAAFFRIQELKSVEIPNISKFDLSEGETPVFWKLCDAVQLRPYYACPEAVLPRRDNESKYAWGQRKASQHSRNQTTARDLFVRALESQWPCDQPQTPSSQNASTYLDVSATMDRVKGKFKAWYENRQFFQYLSEVTSILVRQQVDSISSPHSSRISPAIRVAMEIPRYFSAQDIFNYAPPTMLPTSPQGPNIVLQELSSHSRDSESMDRLSTLCQHTGSLARSKCEEDYILHLKASVSALQETLTQSWTISGDSDVSTSLHAYFEDCKEYLERLEIAFEVTVQGYERHSYEGIAAYIRLSPRTPQTFWLRQLNKDNWSTLSPTWRSMIIKYGLAITELQRAQRLLRLTNSPIDLVEELRNKGHQNWDPERFPESLLLEAESGIMIREVQEEIANEMRSPPGNENSVMQLNMGEGKSSVIVPIVAAAIADGSRLARVIVAKPQSKQMFQMLVSKYGGLLDRRIFHMPFSRTLKLGQHEADIMRTTFETCMVSGGILLLLPEHVLSFQLMGIECLLSDQAGIGRSLLATQEFFDTMSRDIVDESDENFSVKFELVYTMGNQRPIQMSPNRWTVIHTILDLVSRFAHNVKKLMPAFIEVDDRYIGRYPRIRTLQERADIALLDLLARHICEQGFPKFPLANQPKKVRDAVRVYITKPKLSAEEIALVENGSFWTDSTKETLLLVRGLIAGGVLRFALGSKRWRVNFGIDPNRKPHTKLAVPFRSKDCPSLRSEFSHPDVIIVLTSLTYYYGGLSDEELLDTFTHLLKSDQADVEYGDWVRTAGSQFPKAFRQLVGINIKDRSQCIEQVFPALRYSKNVVDYFLAHLIFPKECKEFPSKLSASGWDIGTGHLLTGFSGTNDSRHVLPLSVKHLDLPAQRHTNALVLSYLLQDETTVELLAPRAASTQSDAEHLLTTVNAMTPSARVILDVGAQILELDNLEVAQKWLEFNTDTTAKAVVFFNNNEELVVLDRRDCVELLQVSPFAKQLGDCLVYLDEAHTRGTDLKLPRHYKAAVTLGANLTKDRLVQACMRMRQLGKGQSVSFLVSEEIKTKIRERIRKSHDAPIEVLDVLAWAISETWADLRRSMPLWATQGRRFEEHKNILKGAGTTVQEARMVLEDEAQTLADRYQPRSQELTSTSQLDGWDISNPKIAQIIARCLDFDTMNFNSATLQEEQERELSPEIEKERQIQRPPPIKAAKHKVHPDLVRMAQLGTLPDSRAFMPAFQALFSSSAAKQNISLHEFPKDLFVTIDFVHTVERPSGVSGESYNSDSFQRPVQWIVSVMSPSSEVVKHLIVISPFEANELLPIIRKSSKVALHLYSPRANLSYSSLEDLHLYTVGRPFVPQSVPFNLTAQMNIFAGQLYFGSFQKYVEVCEFLGLAWSAAKDGQVVQADGFIASTIGKWGLTDSPVAFLKVLLTNVRRNCEGVEKTHMGKVLDGALLEERDFE
ncbi:hypothetical protein K504DRAFT_492980 [Pleomassaria siparia CBS 279.74]|uniref:ubiquitinyl hydrolase 1 n=1 Tax=Pleomassaria siparia CBS 279.74 TaxID=1314801 RepID=A0A6G1K118_9PLEO|nr:hypothetical protein K504DRAFT_492980 [Pleomassaria siparia CBS 279.74]